MHQTRRMSAVEAVANVAVGYLIAVLSQIVVFPLFGVQASLGQNLAIGLAFSVISVVRSYLLRRWFERARRR